MLKSGGENGTSFLNSRKVKSVLSAFYFWKMASKFQEMGGVLGFVPRKLFSFPQNSDSVGRKLFPSLAILFSSLAISFSSDGIFISSDVFSIISRDFFTKVRSFPLKEGKFRKNEEKSSENIKKLRNSKALRIDYFRPTLLELQMAC